METTVPSDIVTKTKLSVPVKSGGIHPHPGKRQENKAEQPPVPPRLHPDPAAVPRSSLR